MNDTFMSQENPMFDMRKTGAYISFLRRQENLTQAELAERLGISYQAVSSWERGASMPDISKLLDLAHTLHTTVDALLAGESKKTENEAACGDCAAEPAVEEAPRAQEEESAAQAETHVGGGPGVDSFMNMSRHIIKNARSQLEKAQRRLKDKSGLNALAERFESDGDIELLRNLAPHLSKEALTELAERCDFNDDKEILTELAPFLPRDVMSDIVSRCDFSDNAELLTELAPFLSKEALNDVVSRCDFEDNAELIGDLAPFLSKEALNDVVSRCDFEDNAELIGDLAPFLSEKTLNDVVSRCDFEDNAELIVELAPFLSQKTLGELALKCDFSENAELLTEIAPFLGKDIVTQLVERLMKRRK